MASAPRPFLAAPASYEAAPEILAQLIMGYQRGAELPKYGRNPLEAVEGQIKVLDQGTLKTGIPE